MNSTLGGSDGAKARREVIPTNMAGGLCRRQYDKTQLSRRFNPWLGYAEVGI
jgi:hypothetical protein